MSQLRKMLCEIWRRMEVMPDFAALEKFAIFAAFYTINHHVFVDLLLEYSILMADTQNFEGMYYRICSWH